MQEPKARKDMDPRYLWDLSSIIESAAEFERQFKEAQAQVSAFSTWQGHVGENPRKAIREAFFKLMENQDYHKITIASVAREADIDRKTFYLHYRSVSDLVDEVIVLGIVAVSVAPAVIGAVKVTSYTVPSGAAPVSASGAAAASFASLVTSTVLPSSLTFSIAFSLWMRTV